MAWTTPRTWVTNELVTAAIMNTHVRDNLVWLNQLPVVRAYHSANQSINNAALTVVAFDSERFDQAGGSASTMHDAVTNNSRLTCRYAGVYEVSGQVEWAGNATGERILEIIYNGGAFTFARVRDAPNGTNPMNQNVSCLIAMNVNDNVELRVFQNSGGALNINNAGQWSPEFSMVLVA